MKLLSRCENENCKKLSLIVRKRTYVHPIVGKVHSQKEVCGRCAKGFKKIIEGYEETQLTEETL